MSLLTEDQKTYIKGVFGDVHDTFKRAVKVYNEVEKSVSLNINENPMFQKSASYSPSVKSLELTTVYARVYYPSKNGELKPISNIAETDYKSADFDVRLKIDLADLKYFQNSAKVIVDGFGFTVSSDPVPIGPFGAVHYAVYLQKSDV